MKTQVKRHSISSVTIVITNRASKYFEDHSKRKQNKHYTNLPFNCDVYQERHDTKNCLTIREAIKKLCVFLLDIVQRGGGG